MIGPELDRWERTLRRHLPPVGNVPASQSTYDAHQALDGLIVRLRASEARAESYEKALQAIRDLPSESDLLLNVPVRALYEIVCAALEKKPGDD